jgi:hypothetical protein
MFDVPAGAGTFRTKPMTRTFVSSRNEADDFEGNAFPLIGALIAFLFAANVSSAILMLIAQG